MRFKIGVRSVSLLLSLLFVLLAFAGCKSEKDEGDSTQDVSTSGADDGFVKDDLPEKMDFEGKEIVWAIVNTDTDTSYNGYYAEASPNMLENEIFSSSKRVEDRLNVKLKFVEYVYPWDSRGVELAKINNNIMAGVSEYDLISAPTYLPLYGSPELFLDLNKVENLSLDKPWWDQTVRGIFENGLRFIRGDGSLRSVQKLACVFFNGGLLEDMQIDEDLYKTVYDGDWTLEKLKVLIENTYISADGTDARTADDTYGVTFGDCNAFTTFATSCNVEFYTKQNDGTYAYNAGSKRNVNIVDTLRQFVTKNVNVLSSYDRETTEYKIDMTATGGSGVSRIFAEKRSLFMFGKFENGAVLFAQESADTKNLGVLPYPKYDENQSNYRTPAAGDCFYIPVTVENSAVCGAVLEAWSSDFYRTVIPTYFETIIKVRYSSGGDMAEMFDYIRSTSVTTFEQMFQDPDVLCMGPTVIKHALSGYYGLESWTVTSKKNEKQAMSQLDGILSMYGLK